MKYSFIYEMYMKFTYITELVDVTLAIWKKCYENSKEKHVIKNLIDPLMMDIFNPLWLPKPAHSHLEAYLELHQVISGHTLTAVFPLCLPLCSHSLLCSTYATTIPFTFHPSEICVWITPTFLKKIRTTKNLYILFCTSLLSVQWGLVWEGCLVCRLEP